MQRAAAGELHLLQLSKTVNILLEGSILITRQAIRLCDASPFLTATQPSGDPAPRAVFFILESEFMSAISLALPDTMIASSLNFRRLLCLLAIVPSIALFTSATHAAGPTGHLNDTGLSQAYGSGGLLPCTAYNTGDDSAYPRQDCRFGRDASAAAGRLTKTGGGAAGFDFTPLNASGNQIAVVGGKPASAPSCVRDNVTNLIWEVKSGDGGLHDAKWHYVWHDSNFGTNSGFPGLVGPTSGTDFCGSTVDSGCDTENLIAAVNATGFCGGGNPWRLPTRRELLSIVHSGLPSSAKPIDQDFFPNENAVPFNYSFGGYGGWPVPYSYSGYWTAETYRASPAAAWSVGFLGETGVVTKGMWSAGNYGMQWVALSVRLVRSGQ